MRSGACTPHSIPLVFWLIFFSVSNAASEDDPDIVNKYEQKLLSSSFKHFDYSFERVWMKHRWQGVGQLSLWFQSNDNVKIRVRGRTRNPKFGNVIITVFIDSASEQLHVDFNLEDMDEKQCVTYPFKERHNIESQLSKLQDRLRSEVKILSMPSDAIDSMEFPWTSKKRLKLRFSSQGELQSVVMRRSGIPMKWLNVTSEVSTTMDGPPVQFGGESLFSPPNGCELFNGIDTPLAQVRMKLPHQKSPILSDLITSLSERMHPGVIGIDAFRQFITLNVIALPGDIPIMIEEPPPPDLTRHLSGVKYDYLTKSFMKGEHIVSHSNGTVWLNMTERTFRILGEAPKTPFGPAFVNVIASTQSKPYIDCNVELTSPHKQQCSLYDYPEKPGTRGMELDRSLAKHLYFVEVAEVHGEDCGIYAVQLKNGHYIFVWLDMEEQDHHAILRVDVRTRYTVLRSTDVLKWYSEAEDYSKELVAPAAWHCGNSSIRAEFGTLGLDKHERRSHELLDTLYAVDNLPVGYALLELLALPGDLRIEIREELVEGMAPGQRTYIPSASHRMMRFLGAGYKHFSYEFERSWMAKQWRGRGELWAWFKHNPGELPVAKVRIRAQSDTEKFGRVIITLIVDSASQMMYVTANGINLNEEQCVAYPFPAVDVRAVNKVSKYLGKDVVEIADIEKTFANWVKGARTDDVGEVIIDWTKSKALQLKFDRQGDFVGLSIFHKGREHLKEVKRMEVMGDLEYEQEPPRELESLFDVTGCRSSADVNSPIAAVLMKGPHEKSSPLRDLLYAIGVDADSDMRQVMSLLVFSLPGDIPVMIEEPDAPSLEAVQGVAFDYTAVGFIPGGGTHNSSGSVWSSFEQRAFHLHGKTDPTAFGIVKVDFIARAVQPAAVWANIQLWDGSVQQCVSHGYPTEAGSSDSQIMKSAEQPLIFQSVDEFGGEDCGIFSARLTLGRSVLVWVDLEKEDHHAVQRVVVHGSDGRVLRAVNIDAWRDNENYLDQLNPAATWKCGPNDHMHPLIARFGIDRVVKKSRDLHDALIAMQELSPSAALLEVLSMPGDLALHLDTKPVDLDQSLLPGATLPPNIQSIQPPNPSSTSLEGNPANSYPLSAMGLMISMLGFLSLFVLVVVVAAAAIGVPVPLLAALPATSAALFSFQVLQFSGYSKAAAEPIDDLSQFCVWVSPALPANKFVISFISLVAVSFWRVVVKQKHRHDFNSSSPTADSSLQISPHGLVFGAWELRALSLFAFPLATASAELLVDFDALIILGPVIALIALFFMTHVVFSALNFVTNVIEDKEVIRTQLPRTAGGADVFADRSCDQLCALPSRPPQPGFACLFGNWLSSPSWCTTPTIAIIKEIEQKGSPNARTDELDVAEEGQSVFCSSADASKQAKDDQLEELRVGVEVRPLLERENTEAGVELTAATSEAKEEDLVCPKIPSTPSQIAEVLDRPSVVTRTHPVNAKMVCTYETKVSNMVAGVVCIPWLDVAVPAGALRRLEETCGDITIQVHPGQLCGCHTSGRYAACFDWGTNWPWRWPLETALKVLIGIWIALPVSLDGFGGPVTLLLHIAVLCVVCTAIYGAWVVQPYIHSYDNVAMLSSWCAVALILFVRSFGVAMPSLASLATTGIAIAISVACGITLLSAMALSSVLLGTLEVQGLQDRLLPCTIDGWGPESFASHRGRTLPEAPGPSRQLSCGMTPDNYGYGSNAVEVILPGPRPALAIILPAMARPSVAHVQLLPGASAPESLTPSASGGDRARLPLPPSLLFQTSRTTDISRNGRFSVPPIATLLHPGRPGRLIYADSSNNEGDLEWQQVVRDFFGNQNTQLADETERLIENNSQDGLESSLVVVEVLPALAAEFMDERHDTGSRANPESRF